MKSKTRNVSCTASTGMARLQFVSGSTLHLWSGYGDGTLSTDLLIERILVNPSYEHVKENIIQCDTIIIDEIGLVSAKMFSAVEKICRNVKLNKIIFGGIQVIAAGSFFQLPPVPSLSDPGYFCFEALNFWRTFSHKIKLHQVVRQKEQDLINCINELCEGNPSTRSLKLLANQSKPLDDYSDAVYIFGTNFDVDFYNHVLLHEIPGFQITYSSKDSGNLLRLNSIPAPKYLTLKPTCKVIVIRNLPNGLVNGLPATVTSIFDEEITITVDDDKHLHHNLSGKDFKVERCKFSIRNDHGKVVACRIQYPLKLGYCLTVDKAQGRTIDKLVVDCFNFWKPGQMGVAVGRAVSKNNLQVVNFDTYTANLKHPSSVHDIYDRRMDPIKATMTCCTQEALTVNVNQFAIFHYQQQQLNLQSGPDSEHIHDGEEEEVEITFPWCINDFIDENATLGYTESQRNRNDVLISFSTCPSFHRFIYRMYDKVNALFQQFRAPPKGNKCNWCHMTKQLNEYLTSDTYIAEIKKAFDTSNLQEVHTRIASSICFSILDKIAVDAKNSDSEIMNQSEHNNQEELSLDEMNILRYVAGASVHHVLKKMKAKCLSKLHGYLNQAKKSYKASQLMNCLFDHQSNILEMSSCPEILIETLRRQNHKMGLKFVTDSCFDFFMHLHRSVSTIMNTQSMQLKLENIFMATVDKIKRDEKLLELWFNLFSNTECICQLNKKVAIEHDDVLEYELESALIMDMYDFLVVYFVKVCLSELKKNT